MSEIQVNVSQNPGSIQFNFEELKEQLSAKMAEYKGTVLTEDSKAIAKMELANLRKLKEAVEKRRKEVKTQCMQPYTEFETKVKELTAIIDEPIMLIDGQLKDMEAERVKKRRADVQKLWEEVITEYREYLPLDEIYDKKWDLAGTKLKAVQKNLEEWAAKVASDIMIISSSQSDAAGEALDLYKKDRDLTKALTYINTYEANKRKALEHEAERQRAEEERRREADIERARAEERRMIEAVERAKAEERDSMADTLFRSKDEVDDLPFKQPSTITVFYKVIATEEELEQVEMAFNSIGIFFERREA